MLNQLIYLISKNNQVFYECLNTYDTFIQLPKLLDLEKAVYFTSPSESFVHNVHMNNPGSGYLSSTNHFEPFGARTIYCTTEILFQKMVGFIKSEAKVWFCSLIVINVCDSDDLYYPILVRMFEHYGKMYKLPKVIFLGKYSHIPTRIQCKAMAKIKYEPCKTPHLKIASLIPKYQSVLVIVPNDKHIQMIVNKLGSYPLKCITDEANHISVRIPSNVTICTVKTVQYAQPADVVIDTLLAPSCSNEIRSSSFRYITAQEAHVHRSGARKLYIPLCPPKAFDNLSTQVFETVSIYTLEKQLLALQSQRLPANEIMKTNHSLRTYNLLSNRNTLTEIGYFCMRLPLPTRKSIILYHLNVRRDPYLFLHLCVLCTIETSANIFKWPKKSNNETMNFLTLHDRITFYENRFGGYSDVATLYNIWAELIGDYSYVRLTNFCKENFLNIHGFIEALSLIKECQKVMYNFGIQAKSVKPENVLECSNELFHYLELTMPECLAVTVFKGGRAVLECGESTYDVYDKAVHLMHIGGVVGQRFYIMASKEIVSKGNTYKCATVLHALPPDDMDCIVSDY